MGQFLDKILDISGPALSSHCSSYVSSVSGRTSSIELAKMLLVKDGFYAFENALHVFSSASIDQEFGLKEWNEMQLWRNSYGSLTEGCFFFAEDVFGGQFCIRDDGVFAFDPETAELESLGDSLEDWARVILEDWDYRTGHSLARDWQEQNGAIKPGHRLVPKQAFVMGGEFHIKNLCMMPSDEGMRIRGAIAREIRDLSDGTNIQLSTIE